MLSCARRLAAASNLPLSTFLRVTFGPLIHSGSRLIAIDIEPCLLGGGPYWPSGSPRWATLASACNRSALALPSALSVGQSQPPSSYSFQA